MMPAFFEIVREASFLRQASRFAMLATFLWTLGCDDPNNVVFGIEPLRQVSEQSEMFSQLPEEDRRLLVGYLAALEARKVLGENVELVVGRTVGEVLVDARAWGEAQKALAIENQRKQEESAILRRRIVAEREQLQRKIHDSVTVAITGKFVLPEDSSIQRYSPMLIILRRRK